MSKDACIPNGLGCGRRSSWGKVDICNDEYMYIGIRLSENRVRFGLPKEHWIDALCVGEVDEVREASKRPLFIKCMGRGSNQ